MTHARRLGYVATCLTCEEIISADERAHREHGVGAWHEDCDPPRNIHIYQRERDRDVQRRAKSGRRFRDSDND